MGTLAESKISFEDFLAQTGDDVKAEWVNGEVVLMSPITTRHQRIVGFLYVLIEAYIHKHKCGDVLQEVTVKLSPELSARVPDVSFLSNEHANRDRGTFIDGAVDIAVEVVSLDSRVRDRAEKYYEYEAAGVREYWLIDPIREEAEFYVLDGSKFRTATLTDDGYFQSIVLPGLRLNSKWLWKKPIPSALSVLTDAGIMPAE